MSERLSQVLEALGRDDLAQAAVLCRDWRQAEPELALAHNLSGIVAQRAQALDEAVVWFEAASRIDPGYGQAWFNLGVAYEQTERGDAALACLRKAALLAPTVETIHYQLALRLQARGLFEEARDGLERLFATVPLGVETGWLLARLTHQLGAPDEACAVVAKLLELHGQSAELWRIHGDLLRETGQYALAEKAFGQALALAPDDVDALFGQGSLLAFTGRPQHALSSLQKAAELRSDAPEIVAEYAQALLASGIFIDAARVLQEAVRRWPDSGALWFSLGVVEDKRGNTSLAEEYLRRALDLAPDQSLIPNHLGMLLARQGKLDEAVQCYQAALALAPGLAVAHNNLGNVCLGRLDMAAAEAHFRDALRLDPDLACAHHNLGLLLLVSARFAEGWPEYEWRWQLDDFKPHLRVLDGSQWQGEDLSGKRLLVHAEQGFGDSIQFVRYLPLLAQRGADVIFEAPPPLTRLFGLMNAMLPESSRFSLVARGHPLPEFDVHVPLLNLPRWMDCRAGNIPASIPYLAATVTDREKWAQRLSRQDGITRWPQLGLRVGLVWAGNPRHTNDRQRSIAASELAALARVEGVRWVSLYKSPAGQSATQPPFALLDWTDELRDYADTAALMDNLDLIITVDTSVAHLAGALGKPVWIMLPFAPDWRWLLQRRDSPWYPQAVLYRQETPGDWSNVVARIGTDLAVACRQFSG